MLRKNKQLRSKFEEKKLQLRMAQQSVRRLKSRVKSLKDILNEVKKKNFLSSDAVEHVESALDLIPAGILKRMQVKGKSPLVGPKSAISEEMKKFASTLHFYSTKAYDFVRKSFHKALPHPSTIRKWTSALQCDSGFSAPAFETLKQRVQQAKEMGRTLVCSLMMDEMSIKKQIESDGKRTWGYVDVGTST